jgi:type II secretory pathway pseudopilin PulG
MLSAKHSRSGRSGGFALVEVMIGAILIGLVAVGSMQALGVMNRNASSYREMTNARAIVQRNIDNALSVTASTTSIPAILATTSAGGSAYDDDGGGAGVTVVLQGTAGTQLVQGTLTRIVTAVANADSADIRRITFRLDYTLRGRPYTYQLSTMRAIDD